MPTISQLVRAGRQRVIVARQVDRILTAPLDYPTIPGRKADGLNPRARDDHVAPAGGGDRVGARAARNGVINAGRIDDVVDPPR